jgi:mannosylglycerate hydrolase
MSRSSGHVDCPVSIRISLTHDSPVVDIDLFFDNNAMDHRLRARFPFGIETGSIVSDGHFYTNERSIDLPDGTDWRQPPMPTVPQQDFSLLQASDGGAALLNRGLPEIEAVRESSGKAGLSLTLLRSVGWLSRDDFPTRNNSNAGPTIPTPDAQCIGEHRFQYAVVPFSGDWIEADIKGISQLWRTPPVMVQGVEDLSVPGDEGLLEITGYKTCVTAIKKHDQRDSLVVRLYNLTGEKVEENIMTGRDISSAWRLNMLEERIEQINKENSRSVVFAPKPYEILSIELDFSE